VNAIIVAVPLIGLGFARFYEREMLDAVENDMIHQGQVLRAALRDDVEVGPERLATRGPLLRAIAGLEMKIGSQLFVSEGVEEAMPNLEKALQFAKQNLREGGTIEEKRNYAGRPLAFCIDWRQMRDEKSARMMSAQIRSYCKGLPLEVIEYQGKPFFDVFPCSVNKGVALKSLKEKLGISRGVLYMGDSFTDNPAFEVSDISVGVTGGKSPPNLESTYWIKFEDIPFFISQLFKNQFIFNPELPGIRIRG